MNLDEIEARANAATPGPWRDRHQVCSEVWGQAPDSQTCSMQIARVGHAQFDVFNAAFIAAARADVPALIARVRELEAECAKWKAGVEEFRRRNTDLMMELFAAQEKARAVNIGPVLHENEQLRSHARAVSNLLAIIHGDGGHYEGKHGTVKACKDAEGVVSDLRLKLDAATYALGAKP